jgi:hypothetical protein
MKKISIISVYIAGLAFLFSFSPVLAEAKQNGKEKSEQKKENRIKIEDGNDDRDESQENRSNKRNTKNCLRAFGHLFSRGWLKKNSVINPDELCFLPFGISKKFGGVSSTTPDIVAPTISNVSSIAEVGKALVYWTTDEKSDSYVFYSTTNPVNTNSSSTPVVGSNGKTKSHIVRLENLSAGTTYYFVVRSRDASGNTSFSSQASITTGSPNPSGDSVSPIISNIVTSISSTSVEVGWKTNEFADSKVYYSTLSPLSISTSSSVASSMLEMTHLLKISGLSTSTKYYFVIESKDTANNVTRSGEFSLTTLAGTTTPDTTAPVISALALNVGTSTINLTWNTNESATSKIFYMASTTVDPNATTTPTVSDNSLVLSHSLTIPSLSTSTLYSLMVESRDSSDNRALTGQISTTTLSN